MASGASEDPGGCRRKSSRILRRGGLGVRGLGEAPPGGGRDPGALGPRGPGGPWAQGARGALGPRPRALGPRGPLGQGTRGALGPRDLGRGQPWGGEGEDERASCILLGFTLQFGEADPLPRPLYSGLGNSLPPKMLI